MIRKVLISFFLSVIIIMLTLMWTPPPRNVLQQLRIVPRLEHRLVDFHKVINTELYVYEEPAMFINSKNFYIISFGFIHKDYFKRAVVCVKKLSNGTIVEGKVDIWELPTTIMVKKYRYHSVVINCEGSGEEQTVKASLVSGTRTREEELHWVDVIDRRNHSIPASEGVAICLNTLYNHRSPSSLMEWMEIQRLMKVDKIYLYGYRNVSSDVEKVLKYYQRLGLLHIQPWQHGFQRYHHEFTEDYKKYNGYENQSVIEDTHSQFASNNDCLYRYGSFYKRLVFIDPDEYIVITKQKQIQTYDDIINRQSNYAVLYFSQVRFCVPSLLHLQESWKLTTGQNLYRTSTLPEKVLQRKVILKPSAIKIFGVHEPFDWWTKRSEFTFPDSQVKLHHYRYESGQDDKCHFYDDSMAPFQPSLNLNVKTAIT